VETRDEIPEPVLAGSALNLADATGDPATHLDTAGSATARLAPPFQRGRPLRRWGTWTLLALTLGAAAFGFAYVNRPEMCYRRALKALGRDDFDTARYELLRLQGLPEYEPHASLINGILLLQEQKLDDALEEFRLALEDADTRVLALTMAGRTLLQQRRFFDAERALLMALEHDPNMAEAHGYLGAAYFDAGDFSRSLWHLEKAAELSPRDPRLYQIMAAIHRTFHEDELALKDLREWLRRGAVDSEHMPPSVRQDALMHMARLQVQLLRHQEAIETLRDVDESPDSLATLAVCQAALGMPQAARENVARALAIDPGHFDALLVQGQLAMEAKDSASALESLNRALKIRPENSVLNFYLAQVLHGLGQDDLAKRHAEKAAQMRELDQQYADLRASEAHEPRNVNTCFRLGLMAERLGLRSEAGAWYGAVLLLDPRHAKAREQLSQLPGGLSQLPGGPANPGVQP